MAIGRMPILTVRGEGTRLWDDEGREYLARTGVPHSGLRRLLLFAHHVVTTRALDRNTRRYLWIEAGFDK